GGLIWLFAVCLPWDTASLPVIGRFSYWIGIAAVAAGAATIVLNGRIRRPGPVLWFSFPLIAIAVLSLLWTISLDATRLQALSCLQLFAVALCVHAFVVTPRQHRSIL